MTRDRILGGQLRSTVGIGTILREELRSRQSRIPGDEVGYEIAHGGWTSCGRDLRSGLHEVCVASSGVCEGDRKKLEEVYIWCYSTVMYCTVHICMRAGVQHAYFCGIHAH